MKRNAYTNQLKRIKVRTPRWFWTHCAKCKNYFKREPMFYWRVKSYGPNCRSYRIYNCMECCHNEDSVISKNEQYFGKHDQGSGDAFRDGCWDAFEKELSKKEGEKHDLENEKLAAPIN